jgi:DNA-binding CsgD family transcriptional regulator
MLRSNSAGWQRRIAATAERGACIASGANGIPDAFVIPVLLPAPARAGTAAYFLMDTTREIPPSMDFLRLAYDLTRAEARLATMLLNGSSLEAAAEAMHVTRHTVRAHLKRIFSKTGTRTQAQLVRVLILSGALLAEPPATPGE